MDIPREPKKKRGRYVIIALGIGAVALTTLALSRLKPAAPSVDRAAIWVDTVRMGEMVRQVRGPGTLVPEEIRWISAIAPGRVEKKLVQPGSPVEDTTVLLILSNPDVQLQALEAERQLTQSEAELVNLRATLETQRLNQEAAVASVRAQYNEAMRQVEASQKLAERGLIAEMELSRAKDTAEELAKRLEVELQRLEILSQQVEAQLAVQQAQVERNRAIVAFQREQIASMTVRAGAPGVLQELPLEVGQWANSGAVLARVVQPGRLKAVLRIPETQAKDVVLGQKAYIDTRNGIIPGRVIRIDPAVQTGTVGVDVALEGELPPGARPDLSVDGTIEIERLDNVLHVGRPAYGQPNSRIGLFRLVDGGRAAERVYVTLGRASVNTIEIVDGLQPGDVVILSDMSQWDAFDRVRLR
ncbi:MAG TPA: HlyD family efflux transporter periplasmic adaptor subunit [Longimicrobiales bacterium]|nr:HlyD family efflux transporter periplasmic adaptor subunit [Longimicrobiales bacterium]